MVQKNDSDIRANYGEERSRFRNANHERNSSPDHGIDFAHLFHEMIPDIRQIKSFVEVAKQESFTSAARELCVTQSAVSHSIRGLESSLGVSLIDRVGKKVVLTREGMTYLKRCQAAVDELVRGYDEIQALKNWGQGRIRIGATQTLCQHYLPSVLKAFRKKYPRSQVEVECRDTSSLIESLDQGKVDYVLGLLDEKLPAWVGCRDLFQDRLGFFVSPDHRWASLPEINSDEFLEESLIVYGKNSFTYSLLRDSFASKKFKFRTTMALRDTEAMKQMAKIGIGVAIATEWVAREEMTKKELIYIDIPGPPLERQWVIYKHHSLVETEMQLFFMDCCERASGEFMTAAKA